MIYLWSLNSEEHMKLRIFKGWILGQKLNEINELKDKVIALETQNKLLTDNLISQEKKVYKLKQEKDNLLKGATERYKKIKSQAAEKANLTKIISKLNLQISELENKLAESMTDKYLVRKIPSGRIPKMDSMKSPRRQAPQVQKYLKEVEKDNE